MERKIRVVQIGCGPIGCGILKVAYQKPDIEIVGAIDLAHVGADAGVKQIGYGRKNGVAVITLDFQAYIGAKEFYDAVYISGTPDMEVLVKGGVNGDIATTAMVVNSIPRVISAGSGLLSMKDLPVVSAWGTGT